MTLHLKTRHYLCEECTKIAASDPENFEVKGKGVAFGRCSWCGCGDTVPRTVVISKTEG